MISLEQATKAKAALRGRIGRPAWLRGVGIGMHDGSHFVQVNVDALTPEVRAQLPDEVEGVPVRVEVVGDISAG